MLQSGNSSYICARCLFRASSGARVSTLSGGKISQARVSVLRRRGPTNSLYSVRQMGLATVQHSSKDSSSQGAAFPGDHSTASSSLSRGNIRQRLRAWEAENPAPAVVYARDTAEPRTTANTLTSQRFSDADFLDVISDHRDAHTFLDNDDSIDLRTEATGLRAGDLLEISSDDWRIPVLAVCLGNFNGHDHFYTDTGKWFASQGVRTQFVVKNFIIDPGELQPILDALPSTSSSVEVLDVLEDLKAGPSRDTGAVLIHKMHSFQREARDIHQKQAERFARVRELLGPHERIMSLSEIAEELLPPSMRKRGKFSPAALYAVHTVLGLEEETFQPIDHGSQQQSYLYRIASETDGMVMDVVEDMVRDFYENPMLLNGVVRDTHLERSSFGQFILKARKAVDESRRCRDWSPHGMLGPSKKPASLVSAGWNGTDRRIIRFMTLWAAHERFSRASRLHWVGSAILRATGRYQESEILSSTVGWTFLQEIGWVKPWDVQSRYSLQLPSGILSMREEKSTPSLAVVSSLRPDPCAEIREHYTETIYCIDAEDAKEIDDGISVEKADAPDRHWIHVHIADPASRIKPDSWLANRAAHMSQSSYLAGHHKPMFQGEAVRDLFSLAADRPCLTFSAKVDDWGTLLDYKITPGTVGKVTYITGTAVSVLCGDAETPALNVTPTFAVGTPPNAGEVPNRKMSKPEDLASGDVEALRLLSRLTRAVHDKRLAKGAMPFYFPRPMAEVSLQGTQTASSPDGFVRCSGDPYIRIGYEGGAGSPLVSSAMQLAGEVAARWCQARGIPIPYRVQPRAAQNAELLRTFTRDVLYPQLAAGRRPAEADYRTMRALVGGVDVSTTPGPNFTMGMDLYTKATSPLRRYSDLLVHWQIHAALAEERRRNGGETTLVGNTDDAFLPFSRTDLEGRVLPLLRVRERHSKLLDNVDGNAEWILQALVRAWKFGAPNTAGGGPLPRTFRFTIHKVPAGSGGGGASRFITGRIDWFERFAQMERGALAGVVPLAEVKAGDVLEVELVDVNVYLKQIWVKALRRVEEVV